MSHKKKIQPKIIDIANLDELTKDHVPVFQRKRTTIKLPLADQGTRSDEVQKDQGTGSDEVQKDQGTGSDEVQKDQGTGSDEVQKDQGKAKVRKEKDQATASIKPSKFTSILVPPFLAGRVRSK